VEYGNKAIALDDTFLNGAANLLFTFGKLVAVITSEKDLQEILRRADVDFGKCVKTNEKFQLCYINYLILYAKAAQRTQVAGGDPQPQIKRARDALVAARKLGGSFLDLEQHTALLNLADGAARVSQKQDPEPALVEVQAALQRCFGIAAQDAMCRTLAAQAELLRADLLAEQGKAAVPALTAALAKAKIATESPETYPDAWQTLAETHVRLASVPGAKAAAREQQLTAGQAALEKLATLNPNHPAGRVTTGALQLLRASFERETAPRHAAAESAIRVLQQAVTLDALLTQQCKPLLARAHALATSP
jgi:hypothetical protein